MSEKIYAASIWADLVKRKSNYVCSECGSAEDVMAVHLITPSNGGKNTLKNGIARCLQCRSKRVRPRNVTRFNFSIPSDLHDRLAVHCGKSGRSMTDVIKQLVSDFAYDPNLGMNGFHRDAEKNNSRVSVPILTMAFTDFSKKCSNLNASPTDAVKSLIFRYLKSFEEVRS